MRQTGKQARAIFSKSVLNIIHGTAYQFTICIGLTKMNSKGNFGKLGTHSEKCGNPHPEYGSWSTDGDSTCDTCDIAGSYCGGKSGTNGLEGSDGSVGGIAFAENTTKCGTHRIGKFANL